MHRLGVALLACLVSVIACGGGEPAGPGEPTTADLLGLYSGTWHNRASVPSTGLEAESICPGSVIVSDQGPDGSLTGSWTQIGNPECAAASGTLVGSVTADGALTISEFVNATSPSLEEATQGRCAYLAERDPFTGTADGSKFEISRSAVADCQGTQITYSWALSAKRR